MNILSRRLDGEPGPPGIEGGAAAPARPGVPPAGIRLPPGPPPGRPQGVPSLALPQRPGVAPAGVRPPPGPPPGVPPSRGAPPPAGMPPPGVRPNMPKPLGVLSAKPQLNKQVEIFYILFFLCCFYNLHTYIPRFLSIVTVQPSRTTVGARKI
jgi:hypothetical protein